MQRPSLPLKAGLEKIALWKEKQNIPNCVQILLGIQFNKIKFWTTVLCQYGYIHYAKALVLFYLWYYILPKWILILPFFSYVRQKPSTSVLLSFFFFEYELMMIRAYLQRKTTICMRLKLKFRLLSHFNYQAYPFAISTVTTTRARTSLACWRARTCSRSASSTSTRWRPRCGKIGLKYGELSIQTLWGSQDANQSCEKIWQNLMTYFPNKWQSFWRRLTHAAGNCKRRVRLGRGGGDVFALQWQHYRQIL